MNRILDEFEYDWNPQYPEDDYLLWRKSFKLISNFFQ
jgi:hypothetical protein